MPFSIEDFFPQRHFALSLDAAELRAIVERASADIGFLADRNGAQRITSAKGGIAKDLQALRKNSRPQQGATAKCVASDRFQIFSDMNCRKTFRAGKSKVSDIFYTLGQMENQLLLTRRVLKKRIAVLIVQIAVRRRKERISLRYGDFA